MVATAGCTWGLFWAGNSGAKWGTNGVGGPGNIWSNSGNPNEFVFVGGGCTDWTVHGGYGRTWQRGEGCSAVCWKAPVFCVTNCIRVGSTGTGTIKQNASYPTLELCGHGSELMIGAGTTNIHINYRCAGSGASTTPANWYWRCGTSTSFSNHYFGLVSGATCVTSPIVCGTSCIQTHLYRSGASNMCLCPSGCGYGIFFGPGNIGEKQHWTTSTFTASGTQARRAKLLEFVYNTHHWDSGGPIFIDIYHNYFGKGSHQRWQVIHTGLDGTGSQNCSAGADLPAGARDAALILMESNGPDANYFKLHLDMHAAGYKVSDYDVGIAEVYLDVDYYAQVVAKVTMHGTWSNISTGTSFSGSNQYKFYNSPSYTNISAFHNAAPTVPSTGGRILFADRIYGNAYWQAACQNCYTNLCTRYLCLTSTSCMSTIHTSSTICGSGLICANSCVKSPVIETSGSIFRWCYPSNCGPYLQTGGTYSAPSLALKRHDGDSNSTIFVGGKLCGGCCVCSPMLCATSCVKLDGGLKFTQNTPYICTGGAYLIVPSGIYVNGGTFYAENTTMHRSGICDDTATILDIWGGCDSHKCTNLRGKTFVCNCLYVHCNICLAPDTSGDMQNGISLGKTNALPQASWGESGSQTGRIEIGLPTLNGEGGSTHYGMVHVAIDVYEYNSSDATTIIVGGHNWNCRWYNCGAHMTGGCTNKTIKLAYHACGGTTNGRYVILLGEPNSTWSYGSVHVRSITNGLYYCNAMDLGTPWYVKRVTCADSYYNCTSGDLRTASNSVAGYQCAMTCFHGPRLCATTCVQTPTICAASGSYYLKLNSGIINVPTAYINTINNSGSTAVLNLTCGYTAACTCLQSPIVCATACAKAFRGVFGGGDHTCEQNEAAIRLANSCTIHQYIVSCSSGFGSWSQWIRYNGACNTWRIGAYDEGCQSGTRVWRLGARNHSLGEVNYIVAGPSLASGTNRVALYCPYARDAVTWNGNGNHYPIGAGGIICGPTCVRGACLYSTGDICATSQIKGGRICSTATGTCAIVSAGGICVTSLSLIHISEPTRQEAISYAVF